MAINLDHQLNKINTSTSDINFDITGSLKLPVGSTAQRTGSLAGGELRFNSSLSIFEGYNGAAWLSLGALEDNTIGTLSDVDVSGITTGQVLKWDGTKFIPGDDEEDLSNNTTSDLAEGTNLYYTQGRFDTAFTAKDTDGLSEGSTNLYYTDGRVDTRIGATSVDALSDVDTTAVAPTNGQTLVWNAAQSKWLPGTISGGGGGGIEEGDAIAFAIALGS